MRTNLRSSGRTPHHIQPFTGQTTFPNANTTFPTGMNAIWQKIFKKCSWKLKTTAFEITLEKMSSVRSLAEPERDQVAQLTWRSWHVHTLPSPKPAHPLVFRSNAQTQTRNLYSNFIRGPHIHFVAQCGQFCLLPGICHFLSGSLGPTPAWVQAFTPKRENTMHTHNTLIPLPSSPAITAPS